MKLGKLKTTQNLMWYQRQQDIKDKKKGFYKEPGDRKKTTGNVDPLFSETGNVFTHDMEKADLLNATFVSVFIRKTHLHECT